MKTIVDHDNCDLLCSVSDNMAIDFNENIFIYLSDNLAIDMNSGEIHMISSGSGDYEED